MPPTLHPYLKRGLDFDASPIDRSDLVEDPPTQLHDARHQTAKRRRIEAIALQYLRGKPPIILTASLKGPFSKEWKNPWANDVKAEQTAGKDMAGQPERKERKRPQVSLIPSPEASRAVGHDRTDLFSQPELEPLPATAPLPDEDDLSGATEFFSVETEQFIANNSPANPFWLRRSAASTTFAANSQNENSPLRRRNKSRSLDARQILQLALPEEPLGVRLPIRATPPDEWCSSASAPMDISSPAEPAQLLNPTASADLQSSSRLRADSAQEEEARSSQAAPDAQTTTAAQTPSKDSTIASPQACLAPSFDVLVPATTYKISTTVQVPQSSATAGMGSQSRPAGEDVQRSTKRIVNDESTSNITCRPSSDTNKTGDIGIPKTLRHDLVASPAPDSSTGFIYRRVGRPRGGTSNIPKARPQTVSFSSSPTMKKKDGTELEKKTLVAVAEADASKLMAPDAVAEPANVGPVQENNIGTEGNEEQPQVEQQESHRSKQSQYSTQAAMLLAHLEFQEDASQSSTSSATLRPWSQPAQNTPPLFLLQPSPAITPLSVFNARLDNTLGDLVGGSVLRGPPVSTQDLFNAASPFCFSTMKKKSERPRRTSLRFASMSRFTENTNVKSPTPTAQRKPLKEKNTPTLWSFNHEKLSSHSPQRSAIDVELPQLDLHASLDFGPNADFTDCFLKGLNDEP